MKNSIVAAALLMLYACNSGVDSSDLGKIKHERDSLKNVYAEVGEKIKMLDKKINQLDTTIKRRLVLVTSEKIQLQKFEHYFEVHGTVESEKNVTLNATMGGVVKNINVEIGSAVSAGQVLIVLDTDIIQKNIEELETAYDFANTIFLRQENLWKQSIGSEIQFLEAKNRKESLAQKLSTLKAQKELSIIKAPFDGVVDDIMVKTGEMSNPMFPMIRLVNLAKVYINADVSESYLGKVKAGTEVKIQFPSIDEERTLKVNRVSNFINPNNRTFRVSVDIDNKNNSLKPNLLAILFIKDFEADSAIVLPSMAIQQGATGKEFVYIVDKNDMLTAKKVSVTSGKSYQGKTMVMKGLIGDEELILDGARSLKDGEYIEVRN